ncbi:MAG: tetratricopeptide repeat protein [Trichodesmium sp. St17_bin3_1_1]|nr:tetratricopeptide repeat protein [Trichodesmium sp. St17_bin3_1_1]
MELAETYLKHGKNYSDEGKWEEAIFYYKKLTELQPNNWEVYQNLGNALLEIESWQDAVTAYRHAIQLNPNLDFSHYQLGEALIKLEQWQEAIAAYQRALELNPNLPNIYQKLGDAFQQKITADRIAILNTYRQEIQQNPDNIQIYNRALELQPNDVEFCFGLANALAKKGEINQAINTYKRVLRLQPTHPEAALKLENLLNQQQNNSHLQVHQVSSLEQSKKYLENLSKIALEVFLNTGSQIIFPEIENPLISIILILHNRAELTLSCLNSILKNSFSSFEVVIVDNCSTDKTQQLLSQIQGVNIIFNPENYHYLLACNQAAKLAKGDFILFLNNDAQILGNSITAAVETIKSSDNIGAVGGKIIFPDGTLQEAGSIIWQDGSCFCYGRGDSPIAPQYMFRRSVAYCSGVFLLTPRNLFLEMGSFDEAYQPAYYEETDYCVRLQKLGKKIIYEPNVNILHYEFASSSREQGFKLMETNQKVFVEKHQDWLQFQHPPDSNNVLLARTARENPFTLSITKQLLFIDDKIPHPFLGSGYTRSHSILSQIVNMGYAVTFYAGDPFYQEEWVTTYGDISREVEVIIGYGLPQLNEFLRERKGYYNIVFVSRPHNIEQLNSILLKVNLLEGAKIIYDSEALYCLREFERRKLEGEKISSEEMQRLIYEELKLAETSDYIISVSEEERQKFIEYGYEKVEVIGHFMTPYPTVNSFFQRQNILFVGAIYELDSPNADSVIWLCQEIFPQIQSYLGQEVKLLIAGNNEVEGLKQKVEGLGNSSIEMLGRVEDLTDLYNNCRIFVAPTRFAAGISHKVHEAAAYGLPIVSTSLIGQQLGWKHETELLVGDDQINFAQQCVKLYQDSALWNELRKNAIKRVETECSPEFFSATLKSILKSLENSI